MIGNISLGLQALGEGLRGGNPNALIQRHRDAMERDKRKTAINDLMGSMGIAGPERALLETMPLEMRQAHLSQKLQPRQRRTGVVGDNLIDLDSGAVIANYGPQMFDLSAFGLSPVAADAANRVQGVETGGHGNPWAARGPVVQKGMYAGERAIGPHQIMPGNIAQWGAQAGIDPRWRDADALAAGIANDTPGARDAYLRIVANQFGAMEAAGLTPEGMANTWFTGSANPDPNRNDGHTSAAEYTRRFNNQPKDTVAVLDRKIARGWQVLGRLADDHPQRREVERRVQAWEDERDRINGGTTSAAEAEIQRVMELGATREQAIAIKEGTLRVESDPVTGEPRLIDLLTQQIIPLGASGQVPEQTQPSAGPPLTFGTQFQNAESAFGAGSVMRGLANTGADTFGMDVPFPATQQAGDDFAVFGEGLVNAFASAYGRQPPSWLLQNIEKLTPREGRLFEGPGAARSKLESMHRELSTRRAGLERSAQRRMQPGRKADLEGQIAGIDAVLAQIEQAIGGFGGTDGVNQTQGGVSWRVVQ